MFPPTTPFRKTPHRSPAQPLDADPHEIPKGRSCLIYYSSGVYYVSAGSGYTVVQAPQGAAVQELHEQTINVNVSTGDTVQYANGAYYDDKAPEEEGGEPSYEVIDPPVGAMVPYLSESAAEQKIGGETYFIDGSTVYKPFYSGSEVIYAVTEDPRA